MRGYAVVSPQFWVGDTGKKIRKLGSDCQVLALYLVTAPNSNALGLYYLPIPLISHETGIPIDILSSTQEGHRRGIEGASKGHRRGIEGDKGDYGLLQLLKDVEFSNYDYEAEVVWVYEMARYQIALQLSAGDKRIKWINDEYQNLPKCRFLRAFYDYYGDAFHLTCAREDKGHRRGIEGASKGHRRGIEGASKGHRSQDQDQDQDQEQDTGGRVRPETDEPAQPPPKSQDKKPNYSDDFQQWWMVLTRKEKKNRAWLIWQKLSKSGELPPATELIESYRMLKQKKGRRWTEEGGRYHPHPTTLLHDRYWEYAHEMSYEGGDHVGINEKDHSPKAGSWPKALGPDLGSDGGGA